MFAQSHFYHRITRKLVATFGTMFNNIHVVRSEREVGTGTNNGILSQVKVPIAYIAREKFLSRLREDILVQSQESDTRIKTTFPRLGYHFTGLAYDPERKSNPMHKKYLLNADDSLSFYYTPVPYNWDFQLYAGVRTADDGLQIVEQILPYFQPEYTVAIKLLDGYDLSFDVPFILNSVTQDDSFEGDMETNRTIIWTFSFVAKGVLFLPVNTAKVINKTIVTIKDGSNPCQDKVIITGTPNPPDAKPGEPWTVDIDISEFLGEAPPPVPDP